MPWRHNALYKASTCVCVLLPHSRPALPPQIRAKTEATKMALAYGGIPWTDELVTSYWGCPWPEAKTKTPWGQVPLMVADGKEFAQTPAIVNFVARLVNAEKAGFVPSDPFLAARCDSVFFAAEELGPINPIVNMWKDDDWAAKKEAYFKTFPTKLQKSAPEPTHSRCTSHLSHSRLLVALVRAQLLPSSGRGRSSAELRRRPVTSTCTTTST